MKRSWKSQSMRIRSWSELNQIETFEDRYQYLRLQGDVGRSTFGFDRYVNQRFYRSREWMQARDFVIVRDQGCDLGVEGFEIHESLLIHHMNPMTLKEIQHGDPRIVDPEFLITTTHRTHNAIHYGDESQLPGRVIERRPGDTKLW